MRFVNDEIRIKKFANNVVKSETWRNLDRGIITLQEAQDEYIERYPEEKKLILLFFSHWQEMLTPIKHNIQILKELKSNDYKIYLLSNYIKEAFDYVQERNDFFSIVDGKAISCEIKSAKPEAKIYQSLLEKYNLNPEQCVFIDDLEANVTQARSMNIAAIHYLND